MRLYIDPNYTPPVINLLMSLHGLQYPKAYELVTGRWLDVYRPDDTAVFLVDTNKKGLNTLTIDQYEEGFKVIAYKKPEGKAFDPFKCCLILLSQWRRILSDLERASGRVLISIGNGDRPYHMVFDQ